MTTFLPWTRTRQEMPTAQPSKLTTLRTLYLGFIAGLIVIGAVAAVILGLGQSDIEGLELGAALVILTPIAGVMYVVFFLVRRSRLRALDPDLVAGQVLTMTFLQIAIGETTPMVGFVLAFALDTAVPYFVGLALVSPLLIAAAPSVRAIQRLGDEHLPGVDVVAAFAIGGGGSTG